MKAFLALAALIPFNALGFKDCHEKLMGAQDTIYIQMKVVSNYNPKKIIQEMLTKACGNDNKITYYDCKRFRYYDDASQVCYAESSSGYFTISKDYMDNVSITISRWD